MSGLRLAARQLARNPSFGAIVVLTLALGLGASTLIYSVLDGVLLKPLPYPDADRIVRVFQVNADGYDRVNLSKPNFDDLEAQTRSFSALAVFETLTEPVVGGSEAARLEVAHVSREIYDVIGVHPMLGRAFAAEEQVPGGSPAVLVSYRFWQRYLGGAADLASRTLRVGDRVSAIVGVMPPGFDYPEAADVWTRSSSTLRARIGRRRTTAPWVGLRPASRSTRRARKQAPSRTRSSDSTATTRRWRTRRSCRLRTTSSATRGRRCSCSARR